MKIHYLQHIAIEGLGSIENRALNSHHSLSATRLYKNESFPQLNDFDWLIILGGPMSVNDDISRGPYIQSAAAMLADPSRFGEINKILDRILDRIANNTIQQAPSHL